MKGPKPDILISLLAFKTIPLNNAIFAASPSLYYPLSQAVHEHRSPLAMSLAPVFHVTEQEALCIAVI